MAKAVVVGCVCVVISDLTPEQIESYKNYQPYLLTMSDENSLQDAFTLDMDDGPGHLDDSGAVFSRTKSADGKATITILVDPAEEDKMAMARNMLGSAMLKLQTMEQMLLGKLDSLADTERRVKDMFCMM